MANRVSILSNTNTIYYNVTTYYIETKNIRPQIQIFLNMLHFSQYAAHMQQDCGM